jgi:hypothetical protein
MHQAIATILGPSSSSLSFGQPQNLLSLPSTAWSLGNLSSLDPTIPIYCLIPLGLFTGAAAVADVEADACGNGVGEE